MTDIVLVTGRNMPVPDPESHLLVEALGQTGTKTVIVPWDEPYDWAAVPLVIARTPWDYIDRREEFLDWARRVESLTALRNPADVLAWNSHKSYLVELLARGIPVVPTLLIAQGAAADVQRHALAAHGPAEVVIKPAVSVGAIGALRADPASAAAIDHLAALAAAGDVLVQPLLDAVLTEGEASLIYFGGEFSHAVRKIPATGDYRIHREYGGSVVALDPTPAQLEVARRALAEAPAAVLSYARVDLVRLDDPVVMELELIEPELFLRDEPAAAARYAAHLVDLLDR